MQKWITAAWRRLFDNRKSRIVRILWRDSQGGSIIVFHMNRKGVHTAEFLTGRTFFTLQSMGTSAASQDAFIVVGDSGRIVSSSDGTTWQKRASGTTANLNGAAFGNGTFIVVGSAGTILEITGWRRVDQNRCRPFERPLSGHLWKRNVCCCWRRRNNNNVAGREYMVNKDVRVNFTDHHDRFSRRSVRCCKQQGTLHVSGWSYLDKTIVQSSLQLFGNRNRGKENRRHRILK